MNVESNQNSPPTANNLAQQHMIEEHELKMQVLRAKLQAAVSKKQYYDMLTESLANKFGEEMSFGQP